jgi:Arc/MetJ family transcription regulator
MCYPDGMRTTLELDDDLVTAAKRLAKEKGETLGQVISELARQSLTATAPRRMRNGIEVFVSKPGAPRVDMEFVNRLRDEE